MVPEPIFLLSNSRMGVTSAAVPVKNASSAVYTSSRVIFFSITSTSKSLAIVMIVSLVIPSSALLKLGVINLSSLIKKIFSPEFRNRLDAIVSFSALDNNVILKVVDKFLIQLENQLHDKKVDATFTKKLKSYLAKAGFDPQMGARPMARLIQDTIRKALADQLLFGKLINGGDVEIDIDEDDKVVLNFKNKEKVSA